MVPIGFIRITQGWSAKSTDAAAGCCCLPIPPYMGWSSLVLLSQHCSVLCSHASCREAENAQHLSWCKASGDEVKNLGTNWTQQDEFSLDPHFCCGLDLLPWAQSYLPAQTTPGTRMLPPHRMVPLPRILPNVLPCLQVRGCSCRQWGAGSEGCGYGEDKAAEGELCAGGELVGLGSIQSQPPPLHLLRRSLRSSLSALTASLTSEGLWMGFWLSW